jgi:hypothetical protein
MKTSARLLSLVFLLVLGAPAIAHADASPPAAVATAPERRAATATEQADYAKRAAQAKDLEEYEGGRGGAISATTIIIVLLVVLLVVIIV